MKAPKFTVDNYRTIKGKKFYHFGWLGKFPKDKSAQIKAINCANKEIEKSKNDFSFHHYDFITKVINGHLYILFNAENKPMDYDKWVEKEYLKNTPKSEVETLKKTYVDVYLDENFTGKFKIISNPISLYDFIKQNQFQEEIISLVKPCLLQKITIFRQISGEWKLIKTFK